MKTDSKTPSITDSIAGLSPRVILYLLIFLIAGGCSPGSKRDIEWGTTTDFAGKLGVVREPSLESPFPGDYELGNSDKYQFPQSPVRSFEAHQGEISALEVSENSRVAFTGGRDGQLMRHQLVGSAGEERVVSQQLGESSKPIYALAVSPDGELLAVGQYSSVLLLDISTGEVVAKMTRFRGRVTSLAWDPVGKHLIFGLSSGRLYSWLVNTLDGSVRNSLDSLVEYRSMSSGVVNLFVQPAGDIFFAADKMGSIGVWRLVQAEKRLGLRVEGDSGRAGKLPGSSKKVSKLKREISHFQLSSDGQKLIALTGDGYLRPWKIRGLVPQGKFKLAAGAVSGYSDLAAISEGLIVVSTREQQLKFFCYRPTKGGSGKKKNMATPEASSAIFEESIGGISSGGGGPVLWGVQKTGSVIFVDVSKLGLRSCSV